MKLLNLGCGHRFHSAWVNVDFIKTDETVLAHNLLGGIPFTDSEFDVVYHSHLLEHFPKEKAISFIKECYRVLKPEGIIRIAVPDLESISKEYLRNLDRIINNEPDAEFDYEWIMLEMYDQAVRNTSGGEMAKFLSRAEIPNSEYVLNRIGEEGKNLHENYLNTTFKKDNQQETTFRFSVKQFLKRMYYFPKIVSQKAIFRKEYEVLKNEIGALEIGRFRLSGEIHQWMYDRYSLSKLLEDSGFKNIRKLSAFESGIENWNTYQLDSRDGVVRKPDSLFMEAMK